MKQNFKKAKGVATGTAKLGIITSVGAGIASKAPVGSPSLSGGFSTMAGFVPVATTATMGMETLRLTKKLKPKRKRRKHK